MIVRRVVESVEAQDLLDGAKALHGPVDVDRQTSRRPGDAPAHGEGEPADTNQTGLAEVSRLATVERSFDRCHAGNYALATGGAQRKTGAPKDPRSLRRRPTSRLAPSVPEF